MEKIEMTNMVMVQNKETGEVVVQNRIKSWKGWAFPGGHVEPSESFVDSAVREIKEETGLTIQNLLACLIVHCTNTDKNDRFLVFLYKTTDFSGSLHTVCDEGENFWTTIEQLKNTPSENSMRRYLPMFLDDTYNEFYAPWNSETENIFWK